MKKSEVKDVMLQFKQRATTTAMLSWSHVSSSNYYYKHSHCKAGRKATTTTLKTTGESVGNSTVVSSIKQALQIEFINYGYVPMTAHLQDQGYIINHKKVYSLMKTNHLLCGAVISVKTGKRKFVQYRTINATKPLQYLSMDIKYIWLYKEKKHAYLLSVMDVYSRKIIGHLFKTSIKQHDVKYLLMRTLGKYDTTGIIIRSDNGSQFIATSVRNWINNMNMVQEFTHIATPEDNAYIEAFHSIMQRDFISRYQLDDFFEANIKIKKYINTYNIIRRHGSLNYKTPQQIWNEYYSLNQNKSIFTNQNSQTVLNFLSEN